MKVLDIASTAGTTFTARNKKNAKKGRIDINGRISI